MTTAVHPDEEVIWATSTTGDDFQCVHVADWLKAKARIVELEAALRPFAKQLEYWGDDRMPEWERPPNEALPEIAPRLWMDGKGRQFGDPATAIFSYGDLRRARELLNT